VQLALHQRPGAALVHERHGHFRRRVAVRRIDDLKTADIQPRLLCRSHDLGRRADQHRHDHALVARRQRAAQAQVIAGMDDRGQQRIERPCALDKCAEAHARGLETGRRHAGDASPDLAARGADLGLPRHDGLALTIEAGAIERDLAGGLVDAGDFNANQDAVADIDRTVKCQRLAKVDGSGPWQPRRQHR
jgi:hypothetical protein